MQAIIYAFEPGSSPAKLLVPPRGGSYAMLAQALGVQRMPGSPGFVRLLVLDRVAIQVNACSHGFLHKMHGMAQCFCDHESDPHACPFHAQCMWSGLNILVYHATGHVRK